MSSPLGTEVEPEIRASGTDGDGDASMNRRRFCCTGEGCEETKLLADAPETDIETGCPECGKITTHVPDHGRPLSYYRGCSALGCRTDGEVVVRHPEHGPRTVCEDHAEHFDEVIRHV